MFNQFGDLERCDLRPGNIHSADGWEDGLKPVLVRYARYAVFQMAGPLCRGKSSLVSSP